MKDDSLEYIRCLFVEICSYGIVVECVPLLVDIVRLDREADGDGEKEYSGYPSIYPTHSFLARLLDALLTSIQWALLALCHFHHFLLRLGI